MSWRKKQLPLFAIGPGVGHSHGTGFLYLVANSTVSGNGPALLIIKEKQGHVWGPPGGMKDGGEDPRQAAIREFAEGVGLARGANVVTLLQQRFSKMQFRCMQFSLMPACRISRGWLL